MQNPNVTEKEQAEKVWPLFVAWFGILMMLVASYVVTHWGEIGHLSIKPLNPLITPAQDFTSMPEVTLEPKIDTYKDAADLQAQQIMAQWTMVMGVVACISVFLSTLGIFLLLRTLTTNDLMLKETRQLNKETLEFNRKQSELRISELQAYLRIKNLSCKKTDRAIELVFEVENYGETPATSVKINPLLGLKNSPLNRSIYDPYLYYKRDFFMVRYRTFPKGSQQLKVAWTPKNGDYNNTFDETLNNRDTFTVAFQIELEWKTAFYSGDEDRNSLKYILTTRMAKTPASPDERYSTTFRGVPNISVIK